MPPQLATRPVLPRAFEIAGAYIARHQWPHATERRDTVIRQPKARPPDRPHTQALRLGQQPPRAAGLPCSPAAAALPSHWAMQQPSSRNTHTMPKRTAPQPARSRRAGRGAPLPHARSPPNSAPPPSPRSSLPRARQPQAPAKHVLRGVSAAAAGHNGPRSAGRPAIESMRAVTNQGVAGAGQGAAQERQHGGGTGLQRGHWAAESVHRVMSQIQAPQLVRFSRRFVSC